MQGGKLFRPETAIQCRLDRRPHLFRVIRSFLREFPCLLEGGRSRLATDLANVFGLTPVRTPFSAGSSSGAALRG